jgi:hypothetical protein
MKLEEQYSNPSSSCVIKCPVLFIHADNDLIIDPHHSQMMHNLRSASGLPSRFYLQKSTEHFKKSHNFFDYNSEVLTPCREFLNEVVPSSVPFSLNLEKVKMACIVPQECFSADINTSDSNDNGGTKDSEEMYQKSNHQYEDQIINEVRIKAPGLFEDKYRAGNYCRWFLCPCIFSIEAVLSCSLTFSNQLYYNIPYVNPLFQYETKKSRGIDHMNGLKIILAFFRLVSIDHLIREEGPGGDSDESDDDDESEEKVLPVSVNNPMIASNRFSQKEGTEKRLKRGFSSKRNIINSPLSRKRRERDQNIHNPIRGDNRFVLSEANQHKAFSYDD